MNFLLAIDSGNTRLKWALHDGFRWCQRGAISAGDASRPERLAAEWSTRPISRAIVSNVADSAIIASIECSLQSLAVIPAVAVARRQQCGVINRYSEPAQLGSDRWAALIAAFNAPSVDLPAAAPRLVVMAGTALTVDALTNEGEFLGGIILPGPELMRTALNRGTARLPDERGEYQMFPSNTLNAISTGVVEACTGAIMRMHAQLAARVGVAPICILSGGASEMLLPHLSALSILLRLNENLVLDGLLAISNEVISSEDS